MTTCFSSVQALNKNNCRENKSDFFKSTLILNLEILATLTFYLAGHNVKEAS